ncbi:arsenicals resistance [Tilletia horrida]|uniref:Arsenicals resistance n=1 Tax=Tilletia horrida TaxID=155126 RepID=A0AAN6JQV4_9BASI|nr:arsenicals resistance [Tilletia horrida]KAK0548691.1 arsenicals resistance [Tilletia horrida]
MSRPSALPTAASTATAGVNQHLSHLAQAPEAKEDHNNDAFESPYILRADGGVPELRQSPSWAQDVSASNSVAKSLVMGLSWLDRLLSLFIILAMILGVVIGVAVPDVQQKLNSAEFKGVGAPLCVGLILMMTPILTKVQYERLPALLRTTRLWSQIGLSLFLNWFAGPMLMLGLAWATLPEKRLAQYRAGVILLAPCRCIAMVMIWVGMARGDSDICALLVIINSVLQMVLYAPIATLFINIISDGDRNGLQYANCAISVLIYLGIPLFAGVAIRFGMLSLTSRKFFHTRFLPVFSPLSLVALLFVIIVIFASQAHAILDHIGPVFRTVVPLVLYFATIWTGTFVLVWKLSRRYGAKTWGYQMAVVQAFTAGSNNFELAIAIAVSVYGASSREALAATIGPLVEVPVLLALSWAALVLGRRMQWDTAPASHSLTIEDAKGKGKGKCAPCKMVVVVDEKEEEKQEQRKEQNSEDGQPSAAAALRGQSEQRDDEILEKQL